MKRLRLAACILALSAVLGGGALALEGGDSLLSLRYLTDVFLPGAEKQLDQINEQAISVRIYTAGQPDPDLIIRPSGEYRLSNFLLWQSAYSEFWFSNVLWPDFKPRHLDQAILSYQQRDRRFGGVHAGENA